MSKAVFLDRDGTLGGTGRGMHPDEFTFYPGIPKVIKSLNDQGILVFLITNQSRIARGYFTEADFLRGTERLQFELSVSGAFFDDVFYCPHHENMKCKCRKPEPGMIEQAVQRYPCLCLEESYIVGDLGEADMQLAKRVGLRKILVLTGCGTTSLTEHRHLWADCEPDFIAVDVQEAVQLILANINKEERLDER